MPKYPEVEVELVGQDGNAMAIMARVSRAMEKEGIPAKEREKFLEEAMSGDYDTVIQTCMKWVEVT